MMNEDYAVFSDCGLYRYKLTRKLNSGIYNKPCLFIMLNPSIANADKNDPTIRRCIDFAKREACTSLTVVNLYALVSTNPKALLTHENPIGEHNAQTIVEELRRHKKGLIIAAWGTHKAAEQVPAVRNLIKKSNTLCLGITKNGNPKHPLYLSKSAKLLEYK